MRKFLFIAAMEGYRWGGSEMLWSSAAERLARSGNEVRVSLKDWGGPVRQAESLRGAGCKIFYREGEHRIPPFIRRQVNRLFPPPPFHERHVHALGSDADLIVVSQGHNWDGLRWLEAAMATGNRYAAIAQCAGTHWWPADDLAGRIAKVYENTTASYFVSQANLDISRFQFGIPLRNAKVVRNPCNVSYHADLPWPDDSNAEMALASVARFDFASKGQDIILQVLSLPHWRRRKIRLSLIGAGPNERGLRQMVENLRLANVSLIGPVDDIEEIWRRHHALVLPSRCEGMPLVLVEAMLCGRPCIATDVGGNSELIRDGVNGFLAQAPTVALFDEAMSRAWEDRGNLRAIGETAAKDVRQWVSEDPGGDLARELAAVAETRAGSDGTVASIAKLKLEKAEDGRY